MLLDEGKLIANEVMGWLRPGCERLEMAGSIRRGKAEVKDVELVCIPAMCMQQYGLFDTVQMSMTVQISMVDGCLAEAMSAGVLRFDEVVKRNGPKYKRLVHVMSGAVVELFAAEPGNWGLVLAIRTGPGEFNRLLVTKQRFGGAMPLGMQMAGGQLLRGGCVVETPTEERFFELLEVPCWPPEERTETRLREYLGARWR